MSNCGARMAALPTPEAVRAHARRLIKRTDRACRRMRDPDDSEALHDFRVSLRRLRTHLRAYRPFHTAGRKAERRLKALARRTGRARDTEVAAAWLQRRRADLKSHEVAGADWLAPRLQAEREGAASDGGGNGAAGVAASWNGLARNLTRRLARDPRGGKDLPFARTAALTVGAQADRLRRRLGAVRDVADQAQAHRARITAKRLRYLLETLDGAVGGVGDSTKALADLQDTLGEMHDMEALIARLGTALRQAAEERADRTLAEALGGPPGAPATVTEAPDPEPGLLRLAALAARDRTDRFQALRKACLDDGGARLLAGVDRIRAALGPRSPSA